MKKSERSPKPSLPNMRVDLESPKLADYLEKPRLVNAIHSKPSSTVEVARGHHAKRYENAGGGGIIPEYRNLRLGNFMENQGKGDYNFFENLGSFSVSWDRSQEVIKNF